MSKPRKRWWGYVRNMIRDYPTLKQVRSRTGPPITLVESSTGRTTRALPVNRLCPEDQKALEAVETALAETAATIGGSRKQKLIHLMYWADRRHTAKSAAEHLGISEITAKRWHGEFVRRVARYCALETP